MTFSTYVRWRPGEDRRTPVGRFDPLRYDSTNLGRLCSECGYAVHGGERVTLFAVGPSDREAAAHHDAGQVYNALAVLMHERCAWPETVGR